MRNEFEDELNRNRGGRPKGQDRPRNQSDGHNTYKGQGGFAGSQPQNPAAGRPQKPPQGQGYGQGQGFNQAGLRNGQTMSGGQNINSGQKMPQGSNAQVGQGRFPGQPGYPPQGGAKGQTGYRTAKGSERGQIKPGGSRPQNGQGIGQNSSRIQAGQGSSQAASRLQNGQGRGQELSRIQAGQGGIRNDSGTGPDRDRILSRSQTAAGSSQNRELMIGDGKSSQKAVGRDNVNRVSASRSEAQASKKKKIRRAIITAIAEVFTLALIFSYAYVSRVMGTIQRPDDFKKSQVENEVLTAEQKKHMTGYRTIAVFGVDSRDGNVNKGTNADVIMICNINRDTGEIRLVSVYRDTYLNVSDNSYNKINYAYAAGGPTQALAALNKNLDLNVTEYVTFNWKAVADGINMLGGVEDVEITKNEFKYINSFITETVDKTNVGSVHLKKPGVQHLDGIQAVAYGRLRLMDTDFARTERQRLIIEKSFAKAKKADLGLLNRILLMEVEQVGTNLTFSDFTELILDMGDYYIGETAGFPTTHDEMKMGKKGACVIPKSLETNVTELHKFLFNKEDYKPSDAVKKIDAKIAVDSGVYKKSNSETSKKKEEKETERETEKSRKEEKTTVSDERESGSGNVEIWETDESGNLVKPSEGSTDSTRETKPGETKPGETEPRETKPGETKPGETKPGESKPEETKPGETKPGETRPEETKPGESKPGDTTSPSPDHTTEAQDNSEGPGVKQTTGAHETTGAVNRPEGPGGGLSPDETTASSNISPGNPDSEVPVVSGPPG